VQLIDKTSTRGITLVGGKTVAHRNVRDGNTSE
jgi:hypothetical protein